MEEHSREEKLEAFGRLLDVVDTLRVKCPWDAKQTNESLRTNTIEEVYELSQALLENNVSDTRKELGDVLLHILFYARIGSEKGLFDIKDVCDTLSDKLIFRHPHVYGNTSVGSSEEVERNWEQLKLKEKGGNKSVMGGVPKALPPLIKSFRIQEKAANVGFDWENREDVWDKVDEELREVKDSLVSGNSKDREGEIGDLLFSIINAARLYDVEPDTALERTNRKFIFRFNHIEKCANELGKPLKELTLEEMESWWTEAKYLPDHP